MAFLLRPFCDDVRHLGSLAKPILDPELIVERADR